MKHFLILIFLLLMLSIVSCDPRKVTDEFHSLKGSAWNADSLQAFQFTVFRKDQYHNIYFNVRNDRSYPFSNLWLFVAIENPLGETRKDTIQLILADPSGNWLGKGFSGIYTHRALYMQNVYFPDPGNYSIRIGHGMRPSLLKGITDIGIRVEKIN
ncbi:MAG TPA: gliding motility lipoprotein GldH [Prolixibacteraceae bacterium]|nr:gliding motility lipoprotein GldH [Prolixibacteraceae bacterium]